MKLSVNARLHCLGVSKQIIYVLHVRLDCCYVTLHLVYRRGAVDDIFAIRDDLCVGPVDAFNELPTVFRNTPNSLL